MTIRKLLTSILDYVRDLEKPVMVRIVQRDSNGVKTRMKQVPVSDWRYDSICIEKKDLDDANWENS